MRHSVLGWDITRLGVVLAPRLTHATGCVVIVLLSPREMILSDLVPQLTFRDRMPRSFENGGVT